VKLAAELFRLQWAFNSADSQEFAVMSEAIREEVLRFEEKLPEAKLRYPELADAYFANRIGGAYFEHGQDVFASELSEHPERRFGFWKSAHFNGESVSPLVSHDTWLIPQGLDKEEIFRRFDYGQDLSLLNADLVVTNGIASFLSEVTTLTIPLRRLIDGLACLRFVLDDDEITERIWPSEPRFYVSEFKELAIYEAGNATIVFFDVSAARTDALHRSLEALLVKHRSETYSDPAIQIDWTKFDDERFEELCYDLVYHDPRFDKTSIRKMGKSRSRDGGRDIVALTRSVLGEAPKRFIFQCKAIAPEKSLNTSNLGSMSDVIDQYGADGYVVMTSGYIDATVFDRLDAIASRRNLEIRTWSRFEIERFLSRRPSLLDRHLGSKI